MTNTLLSRLFDPTVVFVRLVLFDKVRNVDSRLVKRKQDAIQRLVRTERREPRVVQVERVLEVSREGVQVAVAQATREVDALTAVFGDGGRDLGQIAPHHPTLLEHREAKDDSGGAVSEEGLHDLLAVERSGQREVVGSHHDHYDGVEHELFADISSDEMHDLL